LFLQGRSPDDVWWRTLAALSSCLQTTTQGLLVFCCLNGRGTRGLVGLVGLEAG
jgi:hypothetical protein